MLKGFKQRWQQRRDEAIRLEAYYLWEADGKPEGQSDYYYHKAMEKRRSLGRRFMTPFFWLEKKAIEPVSHWMNRADLFNILEKAGILIAVFVFLIEYGERREKAIYEAWSVVKAGQEEQTGVVTMALERLHREKFSLSGIDVRGTSLHRVNLKEAELWRANLKGANLVEANLKGANLAETNLQKVYLVEANLQRSSLWRAKLQEVYLVEANLQKANLVEANLGRASLIDANLEGADLRKANLQRATLWSANLQKADLLETNLKESDLWNANLKGANLVGANLTEAKFCKTTMPDGTVKTHKPDCPSWVEID